MSKKPELINLTITENQRKMLIEVINHTPFVGELAEDVVELKKKLTPTEEEKK